MDSRNLITCLFSKKRKIKIDLDRIVSEPVIHYSTQFDYVYLTGRNLENCQKAATEILKSSANAKSKLIPFQMDLTDKDSKQKFLDHLDKEHSGYDVLVQNAAIAFKNAATEPFHEQAEITLKTNFWGTLGMFENYKILNF